MTDDYSNHCQAASNNFDYLHRAGVLLECPHSYTTRLHMIIVLFIIFRYSLRGSVSSVATPSSRKTGSIHFWISISDLREMISRKIIFPCFSKEIRFGYMQIVHLLVRHVLGEHEPDLFLLCIEERELILECPHSSMTIHIDQHCQCFLQTPCKSTFSSISIVLKLP